MASANVRVVAPLACSSSSFVKPGGNSDASRCVQIERRTGEEIELIVSF